MMQYWQGLSNRERLMILLAGGLSFAFILWQFVYIPLTEARSAAERDYARQARETYETLDGLRELSARADAAQDDAPIQISNESLELQLSRSAGAVGLDIVRLQPSGDGGLTVWFEQANPQIVLSWMTDLETNKGLAIRAFDLRKRDDAETLRGSIEFMRSAVS